MSSKTLMQRGRWAAQAQMIDSCLIEHPTGHTTDATTGAVTEIFSLVYNGQCKVNHVSSPSQQDVAEAGLAVLNPTVHVPMSVVGVVEGDRVTIVLCLLDPELTGRRFRVRGPIHNTYLTARRLECIEVTS
jgi:Family of unknown function (DUF6093)